MLDALAGWERGLLPNLAAHGFEIVEPHSPAYNCVALTLGMRDRSIDPERFTITAVDEIYAAHGFKPAAEVNLTLEPGVEKVVIMAHTPGSFFEEKLREEYEDRGRTSLLDSGPIFRHAILQEETGLWLSKNGWSGPLLRVEHPEALSGREYGAPIRVYARPRSFDLLGLKKPRGRSSEAEDA